MTGDTQKRDLFRKVIRQRGENTEALEKRERGSFVYNRFTPIGEKIAPDTSEKTEDPESK
jgi:hypothetical protein